VSMGPEGLALQQRRFSLKRGSQEDISMRKCVLVVAVTIGAALALAAPSLADTTVNVKASFTEGISKQFGCTAPQGVFGTNCGAGKMVPFGSATEFIQFGSGINCPFGPTTCDLRTITVAQGTLVSDEVFSSPACSGACKSHGVGRPGSGTLTDTVVSGSGIFVDAVGDVLTGSVKTAGGSTQILLSGPITVVP
jgi:hypothetical protein